MIKTRFSILLHILTLLIDTQEEWINSTFIAGSLNVNPAMVRKELIALKASNWIESKEGNKGGVKLAISPKTLLLSDILILAKEDNTLLSLGKNTPNPNCPIGKDINKHLANLYKDIDHTIIEKLKQITLLDFKNQF